jgi:hypothetical protein
MESIGGSLRPRNRASVSGRRPPPGDAPPRVQLSDPRTPFAVLYFASLAA